MKPDACRKEGRCLVSSMGGPSGSSNQDGRCEVPECYWHKAANPKQQGRGEGRQGWGSLYSHLTRENRQRSKEAIMLALLRAPLPPPSKPDDQLF